MESQIADDIDEREVCPPSLALAMAHMRLDLSQSVRIEELAARVQLSRAHFIRAFKRATGHTPHQWRLFERVRAAMHDLTAAELTSAQIALKYGFADQAHFTRVFKRLVGVPPASWRAGSASTGYASRTAM
ncbi:MAG TPA: AraC family transcriptional regulator [Paraburkholderia sp.]|jgi:transcriptional regulator GlxA family with amidase domain|uniref:AraC family transcriptional regulator n=1 Tax=Paraburkholderia sp. TaxID=1926495 RepID=UPI002DE89370|nr:AraC family transcriptional regulator [Paraburkholderia sp.]